MPLPKPIWFCTKRTRFLTRQRVQQLRLQVWEDLGIRPQRFRRVDSRNPPSDCKHKPETDTPHSSKLKTLKSNSEISKSRNPKSRNLISKNPEQNRRPDPPSHARAGTLSRKVDVLLDSLLQDLSLTIFWSPNRKP